MEKFDENNLWHCNADLLFGFVCQYCDETLCFDDVPNIGKNYTHDEACIKVSNEAKKLGWQLIEELSFSCPKCSK